MTTNAIEWTGKFENGQCGWTEGETSGNAMITFVMTTAKSTVYQSTVTFNKPNGVISLPVKYPASVTINYRVSITESVDKLDSEYKTSSPQTGSEAVKAWANTNFVDILSKYLKEAVDKNVPNLLDDFKSMMGKKFIPALKNAKAINAHTRAMEAKKNDVIDNVGHAVKFVSFTFRLFVCVCVCGTSRYSQTACMSASSLVHSVDSTPQGRHTKNT